MGILRSFADSVAATSTPAFGFQRDAAAMFQFNDAGDCGDPSGDLIIRDEVIDLLYQDFDGQDYDGVTVFGAFRFLPFADAVDRWRSICEYCSVESRSSDDRLKGGFVWRDGWFPFARESDSGGLLVVDFDPSELGTKGQVFYMPNSDVPGISVATSFDKLVELRLRQLAASAYEIQFNYYASLLCVICERVWDPEPNEVARTCICPAPTLFVEM